MTLHVCVCQAASVARWSIPTTHGWSNQEATLQSAHTPSLRCRVLVWKIVACVQVIVWLIDACAQVLALLGEVFVKATQYFATRKICGCLLSIGEVHAAETKACHVESNMTRVLQAGTVTGQMKALLEAALPTVTKARAVFVQRMCVAECSLFVHALALCALPCTIHRQRTPTAPCARPTGFNLGAHALVAYHVLCAVVAACWWCGFNCVWL